MRSRSRHATGALVAARMVYAGTPPAGYVLLGCAVRPGAEVMAWQSERIAWARHAFP